MNLNPGCGKYNCHAFFRTKPPESSKILIKNMFAILKKAYVA